jgi:hypothetical protein
MKELINLIVATDTANPAELPEIYKQIIESWEQLNK